jgi:hypothetical protein
MDKISSKDIITWINNMDIKKEICSDGSITYRNENNELHREDGPAVEYRNGDKCWWLNGKLHREDGPAIQCASGRKEWYLNGKLHRIGGPAIEWNRDAGWFINGKLHHENGPAIIHSNGDKEYWLNGKRYDNIYNISSDEEWIKLVSKILLLG